MRDIEYRLPFHGQSATNFLYSFLIIIVTCCSSGLTLNLLRRLYGH
jgi:hypothetical protein